MIPVIDNLIIDGVAIPIHATFQLTQVYNPTSAGVNFLRLMDGDVTRQEQWSRLDTIITGSGNLPLPILDSIDYTGSYNISCIQPISFKTVSLTPTILRAVRPDSIPVVAGILDYQLVPTTGVLVGQVLTITSIPGVVEYVVQYLPILTVTSIPPVIGGQPHDAISNFTLNCIEKRA